MSETLFDEPVSDETVSDDELTALALAAGDPDQPLAGDAVALTVLDPDYGDVLPDWYMPAPVAGHRSHGHSAVAALVVTALVAINCAGLCVTYGILVLA